MKKIGILFLMILLYLKVDAQNTIQGFVTDTHNNPLIGATVFLPELNKGTTTNKSGAYKIENLPAGNLKIQFSFVGYNTQLQSINIIEKINQLDITLTVAVIESEDVVISAGSVGSQHENAVKIDVIKKKDIMLSGTSNFMESLTQVPGVDMISRGQGIAKPVIRGLSMNNILVLNNGVRIENYQFGENHPIGIDDNDLERVEIIKGPASLLYGSDAIGGVLNIIKERPAPTGEIIGNYRLALHSNTKGLNNNIGIKGAGRNVFGGIRFGYKNHADYLQGGGEFVPNTRFNETTFNANSGYTGRLGSFKIFYDYFAQKLGMSVPGIGDLILHPDRKNNLWYQDLTYQSVSSQNSIYLQNFRWLINGAFQNAQRKLYTDTDVPFVEMNLNTITYESKLYLPSNEQSEYIIGFQGMTQTNRNLHNRKSQFLPDANTNNFGFLGLIQYTIYKKIKLQSGLRYDLFHTRTYALGTEGTDDYHSPVDKEYTNFNGSLGATYNPVDKIVIRMNIAKAYRVPNLSELTSNGLHGNRYETGNENLLPQNSVESDISVHYHGTLVSFDLAGFYNRLYNYIFLAPTSDTTAGGVQIFRFSQTNANLYGGEALLHFHPELIPWMHIQVSYSSVLGIQENGEYLPFIPASKFRYELKAEGTDKGSFKHPSIRIAALSALEQNNPSPDETATKAYTLVDLNFTTEIRISQQTLVFAFSVNNLFDIQYYDHLSILKSLEYYNEGRNFCISLNVPFRITKSSMN